jgi:aspartate/tyrosine/aromatic aminotransferase
MTDRFNELPSTTVDQIMVANAQWPAFLAEHPGAVNTTIGVMIDPNDSSPWQPHSVKQARENALHDALGARAFGYQNQSGYDAYLAAVGEQVFGRDSYIRNAPEILAFQTLGGTGALSLAKDVLEVVVKKDRNGHIPLVLDAGWPNHPAIFAEPFTVQHYQHMDAQTGAYNHQAALAAFSSAPDNAIFLLQTCGYNDDGMDRTPEEWDEILQIAQDKQATILLDSAYMGLVDGFDKDRYPIEKSMGRGLLTLISFSASKNMGLYNDRLGALFIANGRQNLGNDQFPRLNQVVGRSVRRTISSAPMVAAKAAATALQNADYLQELEEARGRLSANRELFGAIVDQELPAVSRGSGLFAKMLSAGFSIDQQQVLAEAGILTLPNSRINLGGLHYNQVERVGLVVLKALKVVSHFA